MTGGGGARPTGGGLDHVHTGFGASGRWRWGRGVEDQVELISGAFSEEAVGGAELLQYALLSLEHEDIAQVVGAEGGVRLEGVLNAQPPQLPRRPHLSCGKEASRPRKVSLPKLPDLCVFLPQCQVKKLQTV